MSQSSEKSVSAIQERIINFIVETSWFNAETVKPESDFESDLDMDSLDKVNIIMEFEAEFDIEIDSNEIQACKTIADMARLVERNIGSISA